MYKTQQEIFWAESFGDDYIERNQGPQLLASNLIFFSKALKQVGKVSTCIEFGANIGMNLQALKLLYPKIELKGIEINEKASEQLKKIIGENNVINKSIFDFEFENKVELSLIKGVLIHINPEMLDNVYDKLYSTSSKYILIAEYYNPFPVTISYRGHSDRLFKRDFAGEFMKKFTDTKLIDYGFSYRNDPSFPQDDISWFLIEKI
jgi:pseudaminic acid biosynthesis-associated methylase